MVSRVLQLRGVEALRIAEVPKRGSNAGAARKTAQRFANEGDAAAAPLLPDTAVRFSETMETSSAELGRHGA